MSRFFGFLTRAFGILCLTIVVPVQAMAAAITSCSLVENQGNQELLAAVDALSRELNSYPGCQNQADLRGVIAAQEQLRSSATTLQAAWRDPQVAAADPAAFAASLTSAVQSVDAIGNTLSSSTFLNSRCGREAMSSGKVILALNDVVSSLAPLAILAGTLTSSIGVVAPYVVGIVGVTSTLRVLAGMQSKFSPDMLKPEHRQLVLRATCEYSRVHERLRYLSLAQSAQIDAINAEISAKGHALERLIEQNPELRAIQMRQEALLTGHNQHLRALRDLRGRFRSVKASWDRVGTSASARCAVGRALVARSRSEFPFTIVATLRPMALPDTESEPLSMALSVHEELEAQAARRIGAEGVNDRDCADLAEGWIVGAETLLLQSETLVNERIARVFAEPVGSTAYRSWRNEVAAVEADRALLVKMAEFLRVQSRPESAISRAELDQRVRQVRTALFGHRGRFGVGESFVESWLNHSLGLYRTHHGEFVRAFETLNRESSFALRAESADSSPSGATTAPLRAVAPVRAEAQARANREELAYLTPQRFATDEGRRRDTCRRLENIWLQWLTASDYLDATKTFCEAIQPMLGEDVARSILNTCVGSATLDPSRAIPSEIETLMQDPQRERSAARARLIQSKRIELRCPAPALR